MLKIRAGSKYGKMKEDPLQQFKNQPQFIKAGLQYEEKFASVRLQSLNQQLFACEILKQQGNQLHKQQMFDKSIEEYEQAISIFRYIKNKNKMKKAVFQDKDLQYVLNQGTNIQEQILINQMLVTIYLNLAASQLRLELLNDALCVCEEILKIDPKNTQALFRKAQALTSGEYATIQNYKDALTTLNIAYSIDPKNQEINDSLIKVNTYLTLNQQMNFDENEEIGFEDEDLIYELNPDAKVPEELQILGQIIEKKCQEILKIVQIQGKCDEVELVKQKLQNIMESQKKIEQIARYDFNKPTKILKDLADLHSIDIYDEKFKNEFKKIQQRNLDKIRSWLAQKKTDFLEIDQIMKPKKRFPKNSKSIVINNNYYNQTININNKVINHYFDQNNTRPDIKMRQNLNEQHEFFKFSCIQLLHVFLVYFFLAFMFNFFVCCFSRI